MEANSEQPDGVYVPQTTLQPTLADLLTIEPSASIFYSYARELEMSSMLSDQSVKVTLFVPTNKAVMALARKPHEGPETKVEIELSEEQFHKRAKHNVERWVSAHIIPEYPLSLDSNQHPTLLERKSISFTPIKGSQGAPWSRVTLDNGAKIIDKKEGLNGDLYLIDGTISID
ncbi:hypothetical protein GALMADRAFT_53972 [Galerina marginata CBS 339.88]|uniref:FAS1 domain-containing protein n=1 Tax=Galerina marginata (strain CBS 339.88) TaxID=685588 RepID=A0A067U3H1_GALM3|nr:hypothetical protein GALMADRAFT_53972 [Galerina marginata CBS 339.88]